MKKLSSSTDPCPYCGRPFNRAASERLLEPFCQKCLPERIAQADRRQKQPIRVLSSEKLRLGAYV